MAPVSAPVRINDLNSQGSSNQQQKGHVPYNLEAEQSLLGALLLNNETIEQVNEFLKPFHFADAVHGKIYEAILKLIERGHIADPITLKDHFEGSDTLSDVGGARYLVDLVESVISVVSVADYGQIIYDLYIRRQLITLGEQTVVKSRECDLDTSADDIIEQTEKDLYELSETGRSSNQVVPFSDALLQAIQSAEAAFKRGGEVVGVTSGLVDLDKWLGGLHPSDLIILAGRPSMGKTALATNIAFNCAVAKHKGENGGGGVAFFSLEMSAEQLAGRILASEAQIASDKIRRGDISSQDFPTFVDVSKNVSGAPLFIDDTPGITISALRNKARRLKRQHDIGMIVVDYLQLIESGGNNRSSDGRVQEISAITRSLKGIAKELNIPVIALSQLSRAVEQRDDKRPQLADLRESGSIEQDADVVMFVYREEYYVARKEPTPGTDKHLDWQKQMERVYKQAEVIIAKQRHGPVGTVRLFFEGRFTKFGNLAPDQQQNF